MDRLLTWHIGLGRLGVRLLWLHLLWIGWTLRGGVILGFFPATAAAHAILRDDIRHRRDHPDDDLELRGVASRFGHHWRSEFGAANRLGAALSVLWALLLVDRGLIARVDLGGLGPVLAGGATILGVLLAVVTAVAWVLQAHFAEGVLGLLRRSLVLVGARPATAVVIAAGLLVVGCLYYLLPGLVPVLGLAAPAALATALVWRSGALAFAPPSTAISSAMEATT